MLLEEVFVTDAPALYMSRDRSGRLKALLPLDGATIKPVIDPWGRPPQPYYEDGKLVYAAAYQQILKGYPAIDYSMRDLIYRPRNLRVNRVYGMSPVEQVVTTVKYCLAPTIIPSRLFLRRKYSRQPDWRPRKLDTGSDRLLSEILGCLFRWRS